MAPRLLPILLAAVLSALATPASLPHSNPLPTPTAPRPTHPQLLDHISVAKTLKDDVADISLKLKDAAVKVHSPLGGGGADGPGGAGGEAAAVGEPAGVAAGGSRVGAAPTSGARFAAARTACCTAFARRIEDTKRSLVIVPSSLLSPYQSCEYCSSK